MGFNLDVLLAQVDGILSADNGELSQLRRQRIIKSAVERYSQDRPDDVATDVTGDGGKYYGIAASLTSWIEGNSRVVSVEYPAATVASDEQPTMLEAEDWLDDYWAGGTRYLFLPNHSPASTEAMRVLYTVPYAWTASTVTTAVLQVAHGFTTSSVIYLDPDDSTWKSAASAEIATHTVSVVTDADNFTANVYEADIPAGDFFALCNLAAGLCCEAIATKYSRTSDSPIGLDSVDHPSRAPEFAQRAKELIDMYEDHMGLNAEQVRTGSGAFVDMDTAPGWPSGRQYLFHGRNTR